VGSLSRRATAAEEKVDTLAGLVGPSSGDPRLDTDRFTERPTRAPALRAAASGNSGGAAQLAPLESPGTAWRRRELEEEQALELSEAMSELQAELRAGLDFSADAAAADAGATAAAGASPATAPVGGNARSSHGGDDGGGSGGGGGGGVAESKGDEGRGGRRRSRADGRIGGKSGVAEGRAEGRGVGGESFESLTGGEVSVVAGPSCDGSFAGSANGLANGPRGTLDGDSSVLSGPDGLDGGSQGGMPAGLTVALARGRAGSGDAEGGDSDSSRLSSLEDFAEHAD